MSTVILDIVWLFKVVHRKNVYLTSIDSFAVATSSVGGLLSEAQSATALWCGAEFV